MLVYGFSAIALLFLIHGRYLLVQTTTLKHRGSFFLRLMVLGFSIAVGVLAFWLLGYVLRDIDRIDGPNYSQMLEAELPQQLIEQRDQLEQRQLELNQKIQSAQEKRRLTAQTTGDSQQTINQLLELERLANEKSQPLTTEQQQALTENLQLFLENQRQAQQLNSELSTLNDQLGDLRDQVQANASAITSVSVPIQERYNELYQRHQWQLAAYKLGLLIPLLLVCGWLFVRHSGGTYAMLVYALAGAVAARVLLVMHEHFPAIYFRYILIVLSLAIAIGVLVKLLRLLDRPSRGWLLSQYREAYASFFCPVCAYPVQRGPLKFAYWTRRSLKKHSLSMAGLFPANEGDRPYVCPCCATRLFESCEQCGEVRHSLLPACEKCGAERTVPGE